MVIKTFIFSMFSFFYIISFGQNYSNLKLNSRQSILNDKAFFYFPDSARNEGRNVDIMSADPNANQETRIILDIGKKRLVFFARELYVTSKNNFFETISKNYNENGNSKILTEKDSIISVLVTPTQYDSTENAILINNLYVKTQDNTVFIIGAYINQEAYNNKAEYQILSEKVFNTLTKGNRKLNFKARTEIIPIFSGNKKFRILLPENYIITKDKSYDFEVLRFQKVKDITDTNWVSLIIYTGNYPSFFYKEYNFNYKNAEKVKGRFLSKPVEWLNFKNIKQHLYLKEQQIPSDQIEKGLIVHIAMLGNNQHAIDELTKLIENIRVTE
jgi:hypothetical protein